MAVLNEDYARSLAAFRPERGLCVSMFLGLDPHVVPTAAELDSHVSSLLKKAREAAESVPETIDRDRIQGVRKDVERIEEYLHGLDRSGALGLALYASGLDDVWNEVRLSSSVEDSVHVSRTFMLAPLLASLERDRVLVLAAVGRDRGTLWRSRSGRIEPVTDLSRNGQGRHDQGGWSQARYQRSREREATDHLRGVAEAVGELIPQGSETLLVAACSEEQQPIFHALLAPHVQDALLGWASMEAHAGEDTLQSEAARLLDARLEAERKTILERWREERGQGGRAAEDWEDTIAAAWDGRIDTVVVDGRTQTAWECPRCGRGSAAPGACVLDGTRLEEAPNGALELLLHGTLVHGGHVRLASETELDDVLHVAALLRYSG